MVKLLYKIYEKEIEKSINNGDARIKTLPASERHSIPIYLPKKWEGSRVIIIKLG